MSAAVQFHSGTLRLFPVGGDSSSGTYDWTCGVVADPRDHACAILVGALAAPPRSRLAEIAAALVALGFTDVAWERRSGGRERWLRFRLKGSPAPAS